MEFGTDFAARTDDQNNWDIPGCCSLEWKVPTSFTVTAIFFHSYQIKAANDAAFHPLPFFAEKNCFDCLYSNTNKPNTSDWAGLKL